MLPLLMAIPSILGAVSKVTALFDAGKKVKEAVTGSPSVASTPEELQDEITSLPQEQQARWAQAMQQKVDLYKAQNQRLDLETSVDANITSKVSEEAASKVAIMRQTTRPWTVRMMVHYVFFPWYLIAIDVVQELLYSWILRGIFNAQESPVFKTFDYVFGAFNPEEMSKMGKLLESFSDPMSHTLMANIYAQSVPWVVSIIVSYMGLREIGKAKGTSGDTAGAGSAMGGGMGQTISKTLTSGVNLVSKVKKIFGK